MLSNTYKFQGPKVTQHEGGNFSDLDPFLELENRGGVLLTLNDKLTVEILHLKYLSDLEIDWGMRRLYLDLIYLENLNVGNSFYSVSVEWGCRRPKLRHFVANE